MKDKVAAQVSIRLAEQDKRIAELTSRNRELEAALKKMSIRFHHAQIARGIGEHSHSFFDCVSHPCRDARHILNGGAS